VQERLLRHRICSQVLRTKKKKGILSMQNMFKNFHETEKSKKPKCEVYPLAAGPLPSVQSTLMSCSNVAFILNHITGKFYELRFEPVVSFWLLPTAESFTEASLIANNGTSFFVLRHSRLFLFWFREGERASLAYEPGEFIKAARGESLIAINGSIYPTGRVSAAVVPCKSMGYVWGGRKLHSDDYEGLA
jgi:hypothetical protein